MRWALQNDCEYGGLFESFQIAEDAAGAWTYAVVDCNGVAVNLQT